MSQNARPHFSRARRTPSAEPALHAVQFFHRDDFLIERAGKFARQALEAGDPFLLVAAPGHRKGIESHLANAGLDTGRLSSQGRLRSLDAVETVERLMPRGRMDRGRFRRIVGGTVRELGGRGRRRVAAFGEMVAILHSAGKSEAAVELEHLWNELLSESDLSLLCAYPMETFRSEADGNRFREICATHSRVMPAESFAELSRPEERGLAIAILQQKAASLDAAFDQRRTAERALGRSEIELRARLEELAEADRRKDEFLAMLGHELRNPLSPIVTALELLRARPDDKDLVSRSIGLIDRQTRRLTRLVDDLLDVSRITRGKIALKRELVSVRSVVERAVEQVRPLVEERGHRLTIDLPAEPVTLEADATRLEQVLANLLVNAAKYTRVGGKIALRARRREDEIELAVADDGIGLAPETKDRIFDLFVQAPDAPPGARAGLGVGLTLVKRLVELHGGRVEALSDGPGTGSEFRVHLPLPAPEAEAGARAAEPAERRPSLAPASSKARRRILVVDDNVEAAEGLGELLRHLGHDVRVRHGGAGAIEEALASKPELVFLDIGMPDVDGHEVARRLRNDPDLGSCVLVALTGFGQESDRRASREAGFDHHLVKPVDYESVESLLKPPS